MPFEIKKKRRLRLACSVFLSYETERSKAERRNTLIMMFYLTSILCCWNHSLGLNKTRQTTLCICLNACAHTHKHARTTAFRNTHWPHFWGQLLMHFMVIFHPAGQWYLSLKAQKTKHRHYLTCRVKKIIICYTLWMVKWNNFHHKNLTVLQSSPEEKKIKNVLRIHK